MKKISVEKPLKLFKAKIKKNILFMDPNYAFSQYQREQARRNNEIIAIQLTIAQREMQINRIRNEIISLRQRLQYLLSLNQV